MLVLTRRVGESIVVAEGEITITLCEVRGDKARIGVHAPADIPIHREEVYAEIERERERDRQDAIDPEALCGVTP